MASNNSFNIPLIDNQVILGKTGAVPEAVTVIAGTNMTIVPGAGTLTFNSTNASAPLTNGQVFIGSTGMDPVAATITPGTNITVTNGAGSIALSHLTHNIAFLNTTLVANNSYGINNTGNVIIFTLPATARLGDTYEIYSRGSLNIGFRVNVGVGSQMLFGPVAPGSQTNIQFIVVGQNCSVQIRCVNDAFPGQEAFQVVSHEGTPSTGV